jgi:hypothetical protein
MTTNQPIFTKQDLISYQVTVNGKHVCFIQKAGRNWVVKQDGRKLHVPSFLEAKDHARRLADIEVQYG